MRARDLYEKCLELDPNFAPALARVGRCYRVIGKFIDGSAVDSEAQAERALKRALELNPRLSVAHKFYANLEADMGQAERALVRLLGEASRHGNDPELFAGLVHACRYCGLYEQSIAAHAEARRLDPNVPTSVEQTWLMTGDLDQLLSLGDPDDTGGDEGIRVVGLGLAGRIDEARHLLLQMRRALRLPIFGVWTDYLMAWLDRRAADMVQGVVSLHHLKIQQDPEALFMEGWLLCDVGEHQAGLEFLQRAVAKNYFPAATLASSAQFDRLRGDFALQTLLAEATAGRQRALTAFRNAGGERLLGP